MFAHQHEEMKNLEDIVNKIRPSVLIGNKLYISSSKFALSFDIYDYVHTHTHTYVCILNMHTF